MAYTRNGAARGPTADFWGHGMAAPTVATGTASQTLGLSQPLRLLLIVTGFMTILLYALTAMATISGICKALGAGDFYMRSDFFHATWYAGIALRAGQVLELYHAAWLYPPPMGIFAVVMSLFPLPVSFWLWMGGTTLLAALLLRPAGLPWWVIMAGLLGPAAFYNLLLGQNGALTAGLLLGALLILRSRPALGGGLAGILCIKPQLAALLPVVLLANRRRLPALVWAAAAFAILLTSTILFGWRSWLYFFTLAQPEAHRQLVAPFGATYQLACYSVFMMMRSLGLSVSAAWLVQLCTAAIAIFATWRIWRRDMNPVQRAMLTICCSMLAVPFGFSYDLLAFSVAVVAMVPLLPPSRWPVLAALWLWPGLAILITLETHVITLPLAALIGLWAAWPAMAEAANVFDPAGPIL